MNENIKLPEGTAILDFGQRETALDVELALDLARLGASPVLIRAVGGDAAVRTAEAGQG
jgi:hypothetical protein